MCITLGGFPLLVPAPTLRGFALAHPLRKLSATVYKQSTIIQGQEDLIRGLEVQVQESKEELRRKSDEQHEETKQVYQDIQKEVLNLKGNLTQLTQKLDASVEVAVPKLGGSRATFAHIARSLPASPPTSVRNIAGPTKQGTVGERLQCTIDTSHVNESNRHKAQIGQTRQAVEEEMRAKNGQETWRCAAVVRESRNADRVKIVCRDEAELQMVKEAAQKTATEGARVLRDQLYPVRVDNANRTAVLDAEGNILPGAIEALSAENRVTIGKISWLSKRESGKAYGSMVRESQPPLTCSSQGRDRSNASIARGSVTKHTHARNSGHAGNAPVLAITTKSAQRSSQSLKDFAVLALSEPYARNIGGEVVTSPMGHHNWTKMIPTCARDGLWPILYVQGKNDEALTSAMELLRDLIDRFRDGTGNRTDVVLVGDFNRHDLLWGGDEVSASRQGEGQPIIDLMNEFGLSSLLPRGTKTWQRADEESTIDLVLASAELADEVISCMTHPTEHGSDHRAIQTAFDIQVPEKTFPQRLMLKNAPWIAIATRVEDELRPLPWSVGVQTQADQLMRVVTAS
ncbi:hypothetical protein HIM_10843 [Hirsutella minnesotensis 3608]|uniref:Endonuclease/exonuclease/phosphatase domain-containing protein n=1 Tax=Hirsutella minnesotensis 3608 TaxID=1043627 RepID=A0A0F7ZJM3_9HYPO|nr:hypothetical protein HIM_10843 [Hirsutella minnesotensis 3608]